MMHTLAVIQPDQDAAEIGELYRKSCNSLVDSVRYGVRPAAARQAGVLKPSTSAWARNQGSHSPWFSASPRTAQRLMEWAISLIRPMAVLRRQLGSRGFVD
jgi:hypothetical protein